MFFNRKNFYYQYPHLTPYSEAQIRQYRHNALLVQAKLQAYREALLEAHAGHAASQIQAKDGVSFMGSKRVESPSPGGPTTPTLPKQEFIPYGYVSRPGSTPHSYSLWGGSGDSGSDSDSSHQKRFGKNLCRIVCACAVILVIMCVLGIVGIAVYLGYISVDKDISLASNYTDNFAGTLRIIQGDSWVPDLSFPESPPFRAKASKYSNMFKNVFKNSILGGALTEAEVSQFTRIPKGGIFEINFRLSLDRRKLPWHLPNIELVVREILEQELSSASPVAFGSVKVDMNSFHVAKEHETLDLEYYPLIENKNAQKEFKVVPVKGTDVVIKNRPPSERLILKGQVLNVDHENRRQILLNKAYQKHLPPKRPSTVTTSTTSPSTTTSSTTTSTSTTTTSPTTTTSTTKLTTSKIPTPTTRTTTPKLTSTSPSTPAEFSSTVSNLKYEFGPWRPVHPNNVEQGNEPSSSETSGKTSNVHRFLELLAQIASFRNPPFNPIQVVKAPSNLSTPANIPRPSNREHLTTTTQFPLLFDAPATQISSPTTEKLPPKPQLVFPFIFQEETTTQKPILEIHSSPKPTFPIFHLESSTIKLPSLHNQPDPFFPFLYQQTSTTTEPPPKKFMDDTFITRVGSPAVSAAKPLKVNEFQDPSNLALSKFDIKNILSHLLFLPTVSPSRESVVTPEPQIDGVKFSEPKSEYNENIESLPEFHFKNDYFHQLRPVTSYSGIRDIFRPLPHQDGILPLDRFRVHAHEKTSLTPSTTPSSTKFSLWNLLTTNRPLMLGTEVVTSTSYDIKYGTTSQQQPIYYHSTLKGHPFAQDAPKYAIPVLDRDNEVRYITVNRTRNIYPKVVIVNLPDSTRESKSNDPNKRNLEEIFTYLKDLVKDEETEGPSQPEDISLWSVLTTLQNLHPTDSPNFLKDEEKQPSLKSTSEPLPSSHNAFFKELLRPEYSNPYSKINLQPNWSHLRKSKSLSYDDITLLFVKNDDKSKESKIYSITGKSPDLPKEQARQNSPVHVFTFKEGQSLDQLLEEIFTSLSKDGKREPNFRADSLVSSNKAIGLTSDRPPPMGEDALILIESISKILTGNYVKFNMLLEVADSNNEFDKDQKLTGNDISSLEDSNSASNDLVKSNNFVTSALISETKDKKKLKNKYRHELFPVITRPLNPISTTTPATIIDTNDQNISVFGTDGATSARPQKIVTSVEISYSVHSGHSNYSLPVINEEDRKECSEDSFRCGDGKCVSSYSRCNMVRDCEDGSDERPCTCADFLRSQHYLRKICDGIIDCWDKTDELNCDWCYPSHFICSGVQKCVPPDNVCDGYPDCPNGDDERNCVTIAPDHMSANNLDYHEEGYLMVRRKGVWGKLCVENFESSVAKAGVLWSVADLGEAVCNTLTFDSFDHVHREMDRVPPLSRSAETPFYEIDITNEHRYPPRGRHDSQESTGRIFKRSIERSSANLENLQHFLISGTTSIHNGRHSISKRDAASEPTGLSLQFKQARCIKRDVVKVKCEGLQCGVRPRAITQQARIVGGSNSSPGAWPWHAALYKEGEYQCGATLINKYYLLSAGHCFYGAKSEYWVARLGALRRGTKFPSPFEQIKPISHIFIHPDYVNKGYINDISVLRVTEPVQFNDYVRPVCLPPPESEITHGERCTLVGWGQLYEVKKVFPDTLQEVEVPLISTNECRKQTVFLPLYRITEDMFCAGYDRGGRDACLGDSGGPLMCQKPDGRWVAMGVTSNGYGCARAGRPGVYTKIANYLSWIEHVQELSNSNLVVPIKKKCDGLRCPLGECLPKESICNARVECSDGSDEENCPQSKQI